MAGRQSIKALIIPLSSWATFPKPMPEPTPPGVTPPTEPVDPGYGIDLGLGWLRPTHPIAPGGPEAPVDPGYDIDEGGGYLRPDNTLPVPPPPTDPGYGIDEILGWLRPGGGPIIPPDQPPPENAKVNWELKTAWTPVSGWIVVAVPTAEALVPTPSKAKRR